MLNIITALKAEATPIIEGLSLKPLPSTAGCSTFLGHVFFAPGVRLGISGIGCANARILTDYFLEKNNSADRNESAYWLNFGIAGSAGWEIGDLVLAQTVTNQASGENWTLDTGANQSINSDIRLNLPIAHLCSVESPQATGHDNTSQDNKVYDMEGAGILSVLADSNLLARVFLVKLISDGPARAVESLTKQDIQQLLDDRKKEILSITEKIYSASLERAIHL